MVTNGVQQACADTKIETPDVSIKKSGPATGVAGRQRHLHDHRQEQWTGAGEDVTFVDQLPTGESYVSSSSSDITCSLSTTDAHAVNCSLNGPLAPGASVSVQVTVAYGANTAGKTLTDCAVLSATNASCVDTKIPGEPKLTVVKANDADGDGRYHDTETATAAGQDVTFRVVITNPSDRTVVLDLGDRRLRQRDRRRLRHPRRHRSLAPGASVTCTFTVVGYSPPDGTSLTDTVTVVGYDKDNPGKTTQDTDTSTVNKRVPDPGRA